MDSVGLLKLPDIRETSKHHNIKDRLMMRCEYEYDKNKILCGNKILKR